VPVDTTVVKLLNVAIVCNFATNVNNKIFLFISRFETERKIWSGVDAINISGLLNPKKLGNFKNWINAMKIFF